MKSKKRDHIPFLSFVEIQVVFIILKLFGEITSWIDTFLPLIILVAVTILSVVQHKIKDKLFK